VFSCDDPQTRGPHSAGTEDHLTGSRVERFQELDNPTHGVCRQHRQIHDDLKIIQQKGKGVERSGDCEVADPLDTEVFAGPGGGG